MENSITYSNSITVQLNNCKTVEIYKTNVQDDVQANKLKRILLEHFPHCKINFDLEDADRILRVETTYLLPVGFIKLINNSGFTCEELPD